MRLENRRRLLSAVVCAAPAAFIALCSTRLFAAAGSAEPPASKISPQTLFPDTPPILGTPSDAGVKSKPEDAAPGDAPAAGRDGVNRKKRAPKAEKG